MAHPMIARLRAGPWPAPWMLSATYQAALANALQLGGPAAYDDGEDYGMSVGGATGPEVVDGIAIIPVRGLLINYSGVPRWARSFITGYGDIRSDFQRALGDQGVRGIVLDVCSGGGEGGGCFDLADEIFAARAVKPCMAILDEVAFSAAYAIASSAEFIAVPRTGAVGSIGVWIGHMDISGMLEQDGVVMTLVASGLHKVDGNPFEKLPEQVRARMQFECDDMRGLFADCVARNRGMAREAVMATEALTYLAPEGVALGLADVIASGMQAWAAMVEETRGEAAPVGQAA